MNAFASSRDPQHSTQGEATLSVDRAEVDGLGPSPHFGGDLIYRDSEEQRGGLPVDIAAVPEGLNEDGVFGRSASNRSSIWE